MKARIDLRVRPFLVDIVPRLDDSPNGADVLGDAIDTHAALAVAKSVKTEAAHLLFYGDFKLRAGTDRLV